MNRVFASLGRFAVVTLGYLAASLAASAFLNLLFLASAGFVSEEAQWLATGPLVFTIPFAALFVAYFAFFPALAAILLAEAIGARDWLFHSLAGAAVAIVVIVFQGQVSESGYRMIADAGMMMVLIGAGLSGGVAYWAVAGRTAGAWRARADPERRETSP